ncbi:hypothetical protein O159_05960 [Leifsonia xyli subsp. cynodontis DSM 46306]|uniref:Integral membrane protein n=1 Tax=Leifsonia xyli subsp. cynodontis DSM 46306 TaxID=1389489 RepID=U3PBA3_LEIXC|nr:mannosyltransferase family protein [Leifsonia xyli]AGW40783.1 hypothetical protein O159_05960 [Leifsonia xyli subsp. cynodontis DSM 46306]
MIAGVISLVRPAGSGRQPAHPRIPLFGREWRWWPLLLGVFAVSRLLTTAFMLALYVAETAGHWPAASPIGQHGFFRFSATWDASFYRRIADGGYPHTLPVDSSGDVEQNPWAFLPLYPLIVRGLMAVTGLGFDLLGVLAAVVFSALATLVLYRLVASRVGALSGFWAAVFFCFGPLSFVLQIAYAESLFLLLMFSGLWMMMERRYLAVIPLAVAAAFAKPGELALPLALGIVFLVRLAQARRGGEEFPGRQRAAMIAAGIVSALAGLAWPVVASAVTGMPGAYVETELSWWTGFVGRVTFVPMTPWFLLTWTYAGLAGAVLAVSVVAGYIWLLRRPGIRELGVEVVAYAASYGLYLFAVFLPQQSLFRLLMPLAPLAGTPGLTSRARAIVLVAGVALQPVALLLLWFLGYP